MLIDTQNKVVDANVRVNGKSVGNIAGFSIGSDSSTLSLTAADAALGTTALKAGTVIGKASPSLFELPPATVAGFRIDDAGNRLPP